MPFAPLVLKVEVPVVFIAGAVEVVEDTQPPRQVNRGQLGTHVGKAQGQFCAHSVKVYPGLFGRGLADRGSKVPLLNDAGAPPGLTFQNPIHFPAQLVQAVPGRRVLQPFQ